MTSTVIHWFRNDLRIHDNPALSEAAKSGTVLPIYIDDTTHAPKEATIGAASKVWLDHSLRKLNEDLDNKLHVFQGDPSKILSNLVSQYSIKDIFWNRCYEPWQISRDKHLKQLLINQGVGAHSFNGSLLWEPWEILKKDNTPYKVFTPYYRKGCLESKPPRAPIQAPKTLSLLDVSQEHHIDDLHLLPAINWHEPLITYWEPGELGAKKTLKRFLDEGLNDYKEGRNFPAKHHTSQLSPYLHFGEISPHQIWHAVTMRQQTSDTDHFCSELGWREFSYYLLYHIPTLPTKNLNTSFDQFKWEQNATHLDAWKKGNTGIPIVDAGMRELWATGYMHNRVRMIVASFLVKNLLIHWSEGANWFFDCLVDADLANNSASWQWVAGCGADAAPYFRIFNPVLQGQKFDPDGIYTKHWVPELKKLDKKFLFKPWEANENDLLNAGITLGTTYPMPIVDLKESRNKALKRYEKLKKPHQSQLLL